MKNCLNIVVLRIKNTFLISILLVLPITGSAQLKNIKNDVFWDTQNGTPIYSQGGGIFRFSEPQTAEKKYFWYGVQYKEAAIYRKNPSVTLKNATFESVTCYSSTDLVNWNYEGDVLNKPTTNPDGKATWVGRLGVAFIPEINKYAMFVQHDSEVLIALADSPTGNFTWHQKINMQPLIGTTNTGDQTVFTDDDEKSYLIYSYGKGRNKIYISEIGIVDGKVNLLDCNKIFQGESREGNCMFKYKNKYYMAASNIYGWDSSFAYYLVSDNIRGPYTPANNMQIINGCKEDYAHVTQTGFFYTIKGSVTETVLYCGDRWANFAGNGLGYNQWFPLSFDKDVPYFNSLSSWNLNEKTGEWTVDTANNFVKNGSFEADRNKIPSNFKPIQEQLTGWKTEILKGNKISTTDENSPTLNFFNTEADRKEIIGEKSLQISDKIDFSRKISQIISSSPYVALEDGLYTLTAKVKNSNGFEELTMYAANKNKTFSFKITNENIDWKTISISNVAIKNGSVKIGFIASAKANSFCMIDDITLIKNN